jgi:hypothetical protein
VASTAVRWLTPVAVIIALGALWRGSGWPYPSAMVRFTQQRARECRTANYGYEPIISAVAAEAPMRIRMRPSGLVELSFFQPSPLVAYHTAAEMPSAALTKLPTPAAMVMGLAK